MSTSPLTLITRPADGPTFTARVDDQTRTYDSGKEGKRQAILDGLAALTPVTAGEDDYLPAAAALQVVAAVLYPGGIQTEKQYELVCLTAERACAVAGWGEEVELGPPTVPFDRRGNYRKRVPPVDAEQIRSELARSGTSNYAPAQQANCRSVWNKAAWEVYQKPLNSLTEQQQERLQHQVDGIAEAAGWEKETRDTYSHYVRPLEADLTGARAALEKCIAGYEGHPVRAETLRAQAQTGAYGRAFYDGELAPTLADLLRQVLEEQGYETEADGREYRPRPLALAGDVEAQLAEALSALEPVGTYAGPALLWEQVLAAARPVLGVEALGEWQAGQLLKTGVLGRVLARLGYRRETAWYQAHHFEPRLSQGGAHMVVLKEVSITHDPKRYLSLADGLSVYTPAVVVDPDEENVVYLQLVGPKQSVRANWAALVGNKVQWIGRQKIRLEGMKQHVLVQATLPCGWTDYVLIHRQASLKEMSPEEPFFLLDDGERPIPPLFYPMLNKCLAIPLLESWAPVLWEQGRVRGLIEPLNDGRGQGYAAWRVLPAPAEWEQVVQAGLAGKAISF